MNSHGAMYRSCRTAGSAARCAIVVRRAELADRAAHVQAPVVLERDVHVRVVRRLERQPVRRPVLPPVVVQLEARCRTAARFRSKNPAHVFHDCWSARRRKPRSLTSNPGERRWYAVSNIRCWPPILPNLNSSASPLEHRAIRVERQVGVGTLVSCARRFVCSAEDRSRDSPARGSRRTSRRSRSCS